MCYNINITHIIIYDKVWLLCFVCRRCTMVKKLSEMKPGEVGTVVAINGFGNIKHRLVDMGVVPGTAVRVMKYAPLADPVEIKVKNFELSLRVSEAQMIDIEV